jgi:hypothetical protein
MALKTLTLLLVLLVQVVSHFIFKARTKEINFMELISNNLLSMKITGKVNNCKRNSYTVLVQKSEEVSIHTINQISFRAEAYSMDLLGIISMTQCQLTVELI